MPDAAGLDVVPAPGGGIRVEGSVVGAALVTGHGNVVTIVYGAEALRGRPAEAPMPGGREDLGPNPYRGLDAFDEASSQLFFGREDLTMRLLARLTRLVGPAAAATSPRLLAVMGPSGSGKSSVARAGLVPALARTAEPWLAGAQVVVLQPGARPMDALAAALARLASSDAMPLVKQREFADELRAAAAAGRHDFLARFTAMWRGERSSPGEAGSGGPLVLLVDQFEETYTLCRPADPRDTRQAAASKAERDAFVGELLHAMSEPGGHCCVALTLRSDFYGALAEHPALSKAVAASHEIVPALDRADLRRAVAEPARTAGAAIDPAVVERILDEAETGGGGAALPLVQFALFQVWEGLRGGTEPIATLAGLGGVGGALARRADEVMAGLPSDVARELARRAFLTAVQPGEEEARDTRRRAWLDEALPAGASDEEARRVLEPFVRERLLVVGASSDTGDEEGGRVWLELPHEAVIRHWRTLAGWIDAERDDLRFGRRAQEAAEAWRRARRPRGGLWRSPDLDLLRRAAARGQRALTGLQTEFLAASERQAGRERRLRNSAVGAIAVLAVTAVGLAWRSTERAEEAETQSARAEQRTNEAEAERDHAFRQVVVRTAEVANRLVNSGDATTALLLALEPLTAAPEDAPRATTAEAERAAHRALASLREVSVMRVAEPGHRVAGVFSTDLTRAVTVTWDGTVRHWDTTTGRELATVTLQDIAREHLQRALTIVTDGRRIEARLKDGTTRLWEVDAGRPLAVPQTHRPSAGHFDVATSRDGKRYARSPSVLSVDVFEVSENGSWSLVSTLENEPDKQVNGSIAQNGIVFSPDGRLLATSDSWGPRIWDADTGRNLLRLEGSERETEEKLGMERVSGIADIAFLADGKRVAAAISDGGVRIWDVTTGRVISTLRGHAGQINSVFASQDGRHLATVSTLDGTARLWSVEDSSPWSVLGAPRAERGFATDTVQISGDGSLLASLATMGADGAGGPADSELRLVDVDARREIAVLRGRGVGSADRLIEFSPDSRRLIAFGSETSRLLEATTGREVAVLPVGTRTIGHDMFSPDGRNWAVVSLDGIARLWELDTGRELAAPWEGVERVMQLAHAPGGWRLFSASDDWPYRRGGSLKVWDGATRRELGTLAGHGRPQISPDGRRVVQASSDNRQLILLDIDTGQPVADLGSTELPIHWMGFKPDGKVLTMVFEGGKFLRLWDAATGRALSTIIPPEGIAEIAYSPVDPFITTFPKAGPIRMWDILTGREFLALDMPGPGARPGRTSVSTDGRRLTVPGGDGSAWVWEMPVSRAAVIATASSRVPRCLSPRQKVLYGLTDASEVEPSDTRQPPPPCMWRTMFSGDGRTVR